jgi:hypothetical protein
MKMLLSIDHKVRQWSDRKEKSGSASFFNSYVCSVGRKDRIGFQSAGAVRYLFWLGKAAIVRDEEINTIKTNGSTRISAMFH